MRRGRLTAFSMGLVLLTAACAGSGSGGEETSITIAGQEANDHGRLAVGSDVVELELDDFYFAPTVLEGEAGASVEITLSNQGQQAHTFTIDDLNIDVEVAPDSNAKIEATFPESGTLLFYCSIHQGQGMRGGLAVGGDLKPASGGTAETPATPGSTDDTGSGSGYDPYG